MESPDGATSWRVAADISVSRKRRDARSDGGRPHSPAYADVYGFGALHRAFRRARRAKRGKGGEPAFYARLDENLLELSDALRHRDFVPDPHRYFALRNRKERVVSEASFRDRVVHHALVGAIEPVFEAEFIEHSYACRSGRGQHAALERVRRLARRHRYFLRMDVRRYFDHVVHEHLLGLLGDRLEDEGVLWLSQRLLEHTRIPHVPEGVGPRRGLPIGNLTSQFWANVYLHPIDVLVTRQLGFGTYTRYMDDVAVFAPSKEELWACAEAVGDALLDLGLEAKRGATQVAPVGEGLPWLGWRVFPATVRMDRVTRRRFAREARAGLRRAAEGPDAEEVEIPRAASVFGHVAQGDTLAFRRRLLAGA